MAKIEMFYRQVEPSAPSSGGRGWLGDLASVVAALIVVCGLVAYAAGLLTLAEGLL